MWLLDVVVDFFVDCLFYFFIERCGCGMRLLCKYGLVFFMCNKWSGEMKIIVWIVSVING